MLDGRPLVMRVIDRVLPLVDEVIVSTNQPDAFDAWLPKLTLPAHTVATAIAASDLSPGSTQGCWRRAAILCWPSPPTCLRQPALISYLAQLATGADVDAVVPQVPNAETGQIGLEPLHAIYRKSCLPAIEACLEAITDAWSVSSIGCACASSRRRDPSHDPLFRSFANVNTPQDWSDAQRIGH